MLEFPEREKVILEVHKNFEIAFSELRDSKTLKKIFRFILELGNIMNGGTNKGQADGFYLEALSKTTTMKDVNNRTIMQLICERLKQADPEFVNIRDQFKTMYQVAKYNLKDEETKVKEVKGNYERATGNFDIVERNMQGENPDTYCVQAKKFLTEASKRVARFEENITKIKKIYADSCEYYLINKNDEKATNS